MESIKRRVIAGVLMLCVLLAALPVRADELNDDQINQRPSAMAMMGDAIFARPLLVAGTVIGAGLFVITLPFTALGGNVKEAGNTLVVGMAKSAFTRCLGCTEVQNEWKNRQATVNDTAASGK